MSWIKSAVFYHIYPLGFCGAPKENEFTAPVKPRLLKILPWIEHMKELGISALLIGPLFESVSHGYDTVDHFIVDRRLGDEETLKQLVVSLHENGIKIVVDGVFNHVGRNFWAFKDLLANGWRSEYAGWFANIDFSRRSPYGDPFSYECWEGHYNLIKLDLKNPVVKNYLLNAVSKWISVYGIDGIRLDVAYCLDADFMRELALRCRCLKQDFWLMGEVIHGDYNKWVSPGLLDSVTNYVGYKGLYSSHNDNNYFEIAHTLNKQYGENGVYLNKLLYNFADNHDVARVGSILHNSAHLYPLHALLFTIPGIPSVYYGSEWGIDGKKVQGSDDALRPELELSAVSRTSPNKDLAKAITTFAQIRKEHLALQEGCYRQLFVRSQQFAFLRQTNTEAVVIAVNSSARVACLEFELPVSGRELFDLVDNKSRFVIRGQRVELNIAPCWARILLVTE